MLDCDTSANYTANANRVRVWRDSRNEYTETSVYRIHRQGDLHFEDLTHCALDSEGRELADGVMPYRVLEAFVLDALSFRLPGQIRNLETDVLSRFSRTTSINIPRIFCGTQ